MNNIPFTLIPDYDISRGIHQIAFDARYECEKRTVLKIRQILSKSCLTRIDIAFGYVSVYEGLFSSMEKNRTE